jgi:nitroreductase
MRLLEPFVDLPSTIRARRSCRKYDDSPIPGAALARMRACLADPPPPPFGHQIRLALVERDDLREDAARLGTYGVIRGARGFLVGAVQDDPGGLEDFGYVMEWAILVATSLGLGTCWLGGTLTRDAFGEALGIRPGEEVPAASPIGVPAEGKTLVDRIFRSMAGSDGRKPWAELFFMDSPARPLLAEEAGAFAQALDLLRVGPSASNRQPWRVILDASSGALHFLLCRTPGYGRFIPVDLQRVDMGIALCHFECGARAAGLEGRWGPTPPALTPPHGSAAWTPVASWLPVP